MKVITAAAPWYEPLHLTEVKNHLRVSAATDDALIGGLITAARQYVEEITGRTLVCSTHKAYLDDLPAEIVLPHAPLIQVDSITYVDGAGATQTVDAAEYSVYTNCDPGYVTESESGTWPSVRGFTDDVCVTYKSGYATPVKFTNATNLVTWYGRNPTDDDVVRLTNSGGALPTELTVGTDYYIIGAATNTCQLSLASGGLAVTFTTDGTGTSFVNGAASPIPRPLIQAMLLVIADMYEFREGAGERAPVENPAVMRLLMPWRLWGLD